MPEQPIRRGPKDDPCFTIREAVDSDESPVIGMLGREALYQLVRDGVIPAIRIGRRGGRRDKGGAGGKLFVRTSDLRAWLDAGAPLVKPETTEAK